MYRKPLVLWPQHLTQEENWPPLLHENCPYCSSVASVPNTKGLEKSDRANSGVEHMANFSISNATTDFQDFFEVFEVGLEIRIIYEYVIKKD